MISDEQFIQMWKSLGSPGLMSEKTGISARNIMERRRKVERKYGVELKTWNDQSPRNIVIKHDLGQIDLAIDNGTVIVFSDAHYLPDVRSTGHRALVGMIKQLKPSHVINNGDSFDGGSISRYPRIGWDKKPTVLEELRAVDEALEEIRSVAGSAHLIWNLGNHDARYETKLAANASEFEGIQGFHLKDHFPHWRPAWTTWINGETCITHFFHSGIHAVHNNLLKAQCHYVTGHTHSLKVAMWTNAKGETLYGVDTGTIAPSLGMHNVDYQQGRHGNHRSGFAVLTYKNGELLMPEIVQVWDEDTVQFRGHLLNADTLEIV